jgi:hypothetical protein
LDSPVGRFTETVLASVAQFDNEIRAERSKGGMIQAVMEGRWVWMAPRGYRNVRIGNKSTIEPDPEKGPLIESAFSLLASGSNRPKEVREWLGNKGIRVSRSQFYRMIHSKLYIGVMEAFGLQQRGVPPFVPLISESTFLRAQDAFVQRQLPRVYQLDNPEFPLRGTVRCRCGRYLTASWSKGRFKRYAHYRCMSCPRTNLPREHVERQFVRLLQSLKAKLNDLPKTKLELQTQWRENAVYAQLHLKRLVGEKQAVEGLRKAIVLKNAQGIIPDELAREQLDELGRALAHKQREIDDCSLVETPIERVLEFGLDFLSNLDSYWKDSEMALRKRLQFFLFPDGIVFDPDDDFRTPDSSPLTGLMQLLVGKVSQVVGPSHKSPNVVRLNEQKPLTSSDSWTILRRIHEEFGEGHKETL